MAKEKEATQTPSTSQQLLAALNDPAAMQQLFGGAQQLPQTLGAPEQFFQREAPNLPPGFQPWRDGDEALPGRWDRNDKARLQAMMNAAGLYGGKTIRTGDWTREDATALREVLEFANYEGIDNINEAVRRYAETATTKGIASRQPRAPLVVSAANPEAVRQTVRATSLNLMGRRLSDAEEARLVQGFIAQQTGAQRAEYGAADAGGTVTAPLSAEQYATSQLEGTVEAGDRRYLDAFDRILKSATSTMVGGPTLTGTGGIEQ